MRVLVALSGGIDSSVTAHLLKEQGHEVIGVRLTLWSDPRAPALAQLLPGKCCNAQTAARTAHVAHSLSIPLHIIDLADEFKQVIVDPFLDAYRRGDTPNPCVTCNRLIKFDTLFRLADRWQCDRIATGHFARTTARTRANGTVVSALLEATDRRKDQSYYLYGLTQAQLQRTMFPLGNLTKEEVFGLATRFGIPFDETYRESQDLCFFPERSPHAFLQRYLADELVPGPIVRTDGTRVGTHKGLPFYTVGQRRGLGIGGLSIPLEVVAKHPDRNTLIVDVRGTHMTRTVRIAQCNWITDAPENDVTQSWECRTRSLADRQTGTFVRNGSDGVFTFDTTHPPHTPGQSLVLYSGEEIVGGGVIVKG